MKHKVLTIFTVLIVLTLIPDSQAKVFDIIEEETAGYSSESDQPLRRDFDLRQTQKAFNNSNPKENIKTYTHDPKRIYKLKLRLHINTMIYLPEGEEILAYSLGDNEAFQVNTFQDTIPNLVNIKSLYSGVDTNLLVVTKSGKNYSFYLRSYSIKSKELPDFIVYIKSPESIATFQFADDELNKKLDLSNPTKKPKKKSKAYQKRLGLLKDLQKDIDYLKDLEDPYEININYKMYGDKEIAPFGVYDDGKWTYFDFRKDFVSNRLPVIYKVIDKYDSIVNTRVENGFLITESLSPEGWTLKNGNKTICIKPQDDLLKLYAPKEEKKIEEYKKPKKAKTGIWKKIKNLFAKNDIKKEESKEEVSKDKSSK